MGSRLWAASFGQPASGSQLWAASFGQPALGCQLWAASFGQPSLGCQLPAVQLPACSFIPHRRTGSTCLQLPAVLCSAASCLQLYPSSPDRFHLPAASCSAVQCSFLPATSSLIAGPVPVGGPEAAVAASFAAGHSLESSLRLQAAETGGAHVEVCHPPQ